MPRVRFVKFYLRRAASSRPSQAGAADWGRLLDGGTRGMPAEETQKDAVNNGLF